MRPLCDGSSCVLGVMLDVASVTNAFHVLARGGYECHLVVAGVIKL